jgi:predicted HicB family RNase H-like nuclease
LKTREQKHAAAIRIFSYHLQVIAKADSIMPHESKTRQDAVRGVSPQKPASGKLLLRVPPEVHADAAYQCVSAANTPSVREEKL